ncbi:immunity protein 42 of polymorphic toxin system [Rhizobium sp. PP-WC-2G-219]|nr:immunity protein 42 of polymorphic toxin system [Rhizobium sp. PP-WC-2G-219]
MLVGDPTTFAVESEITEAYPSEPQMALGYFNIYILGKRYGVFHHNASLLGSSFQEVVERLERRGEHTATQYGRYDGYALAEQFLNAYYGESSDPELTDAIFDRHILWAPDGDAAFDDGGHVFHFDVGNKVRLLGCINSRPQPERFAELWLDADDFYGLLGAWRDAFFEDWQSALTSRRLTQ